MIDCVPKEVIKLIELDTALSEEDLTKVVAVQFSVDEGEPPHCFITLAPNDETKRFRMKQFRYEGGAWKQISS